MKNELNKLLENRIYNHEDCVSKIEELSDKQTIEFADWLNNGRFSQYGNSWTNPKLPKNSKGDWVFFTSKQLYEIFKRERSETVA